MASKIVVLGNVGGQFESAFKKLATLHAKNQFSFAIITGNLFSNNDEITISRLLNGEINVPLSTYFTIGTISLPARVVSKIENNEDICENLHYLGKRSITKTSNGIRIVTLGGVLDETIVSGQSQEQYLPYHTVGDAISLRGANKADILLTSVWPAGVWNNSTKMLEAEQKAEITSSQHVADLCAAIRPRYHFTSSPADFFYEREPFFYPEATQEENGSKLVTRFISMAPYGNSVKAKAMYAFNLQANETVSTVPPDSTMSPFLRAGVKRRADKGANDGYQGRFANGDQHRPHHKRRHRSPAPDPSRCFFCLSNANLETHMVCSIGDYSYVAAAKGPLPGSDFYSTFGLDFPCHQIIIPIAHEATMMAIGAEGETTFNEMTRYRETLQGMVANQSKHKLGAVTWEISRANNIHIHWQFLPVPIDSVPLVEAALKVEAENLRYPKIETKTLGSAINEAGDFLRVWISSDDGETVQGKELIMRIDDSFRFDLQYPRKVIAKLLKLEKRAIWRDVVQSIKEETADADRFKKAFNAWDFNK